MKTKQKSGKEKNAAKGGTWVASEPARSHTIRRICYGGKWGATTTAQHYLTGSLHKERPRPLFGNRHYKTFSCCNRNRFRHLIKNRDEVPKKVKLTPAGTANIIGSERDGGGTANMPKGGQGTRGWGIFQYWAPYSWLSWPQPIWASRSKGRGKINLKIKGSCPH